MKSLFPVIRTLRLQVACATTLTLGSCAVQALSVDEARHQLTRTAFGAASHESRESAIQVPICRTSSHPRSGRAATRCTARRPSLAGGAKS